MDRLIIQCAVTGSPDPDPKRLPNLPTKPQQLVERVVRLAAELERPAGDAEQTRKLLGSEPNPS